jgi:hypothetical protein
MTHESIAKMVRDATGEGLHLWLSILQMLVTADRKTDRRKAEDLLRRMAKTVKRRPTLDDLRRARCRAR